MKKSLHLVLLVGTLTCSGAEPVPEIPLKVGPRLGLKVSPVSPEVTDLEVTGPNPHFWSEPVPPGFDPEKHSVLAFEYFSPSGAEAVSLRYRQSDGSMTFGGSLPLPLAETWQPFAIDFSGTDPLPPKGDPKMRFHLSLKLKPGGNLRIRNFKVRSPTDAEISSRQNEEKLRAIREREAEAYLAYVESDFPSQITKVEIFPEEIVVSGNTNSPSWLSELPAHFPSHGKASHAVAEIATAGDFVLKVNRFADGPGKRDRALSRWRIQKKNGEMISACRWPDVVSAEVSRDLDRLTAVHQKGLGGIPLIQSADHEIFELGIQHATVNFVLDGLISKDPKPGLKSIAFEGQRYFLNEKFLQGKDATIQHLCDRGIIVTCILLIGNREGSLMTHPEAEPRGTFAMPNLASEQGAKLYRAALDFLTNRYATKERRITNWVIHNEVDQAGTWTNMGDQPLGRYLETYMRSARLVYHAARLRDPHARVFISLTHHWSKTSPGVGVYNVREMIDLFSLVAKQEGEFDWGVAYHPYPQNLRDPDTWLDADVTYDFDTPYITPRNLEVLPAYLGDRPILLSEQGFNTPTLSEADQKRQVAGLIYTFRKLPKFPTIEAYHLHRYQDMPDREGGLRLGILDENGNRKLGWDAYQAIGTENVEEFEKMADALLPENERGGLKKVSVPENAN